MWSEIAGGASIVALAGIVIRIQCSRFNRIAKKVNEKTDKEMCNQRYGELIDKLVFRDKRFDKIDSTLEKHHQLSISQGNLLASIDTKLDFLNGGKK